MMHPVPPTPHQQDRMALIVELGCIVSRLKGLGKVPAEVHHLVSGGKRRGHDFTVGINSWLHRGVPVGEMTVEQCRAEFGPSLQHGSKPFHAAHGSDDELLDIQNALLRAAGFDPTPRGDAKKRKAPSRKGQSAPIQGRGFDKAHVPLRSRGFEKQAKESRSTSTPSKILPRQPL